MILLTKEIFLNTMGDFTWFWGSTWLIETEYGYFIWYNADHGPEGMRHKITPFPGTYADFLNIEGSGGGRNKGKNLIRNRIATDDILLITDRDEIAEHLYNLSGHRFKDKVDGWCTTPFNQANEDKLPEAANAYRLADLALPMLDITKKVEQMFEKDSEGFTA